VIFANRVITTFYTNYNLQYIKTKQTGNNDIDVDEFVSSQ